MMFVNNCDTREVSRRGDDMSGMSRNCLGE